MAPPLFPRSRCLDNLRRPTLFFLTHNLFSLFNLVFMPEKSNQVAHDMLEAFSLQCFISLFILNVDPSNLISAVFILDSHDKLQKHRYDNCRITGCFFNWDSPENVSRLPPPKFASTGPPLNFLSVGITFTSPDT